jgi:hypothetical protein
MIQEIQAITAHDCFGAAFELFGKVWPALGPILLMLAAWIMYRMIRELWNATVGRFLEDERKCDPQNIDELCGHDWNPQDKIK